MKDQDALTQLLGLVTDGVTTLDEQGQANWPQVGAEATYLLTEAECAAAFVARQTPVEISVVKGTTLYQNNKRSEISRFFVIKFIWIRRLILQLKTTSILYFIDEISEKKYDLI